MEAISHKTIESLSFEDSYFMKKTWNYNNDKCL